MPLSVHDVADYLILQADAESGDVMTHLRLQKLVYYAQAWHLAIYSKPLFRETIQAWVHGPVCPVLWSRFANMKFQPILPEHVRENRKQIAGKEKELLDEIWQVYGQFTAKHLEDMTHNEDFWKEARGDTPEAQFCITPISRESMEHYYSARLRKA
jgi:uncharacterized phage-associated protein